MSNRSTEGFQGWNYQHVPRESVPPDDSGWEGVAVHLDASWDDLTFVWVVILVFGSIGAR